MNSARLARSTKSRLFIYICAVFVFGIIVYLFHGSQTQLDDNRKELVACSQQTESLSAQLQVIFEYKLRLEKSLQKEKTEHKQTKESFEQKIKEEKDNSEKELNEAAKKFHALQQSYNFLLTKQKDSEDENNELRKKNIKLLDDLEVQKKQLNAKVTEEQQIRQNRERDLEQLKARHVQFDVKYTRAIAENERLKKEQLPELEKSQIQLESELQEAKRKLAECEGGNPVPVEKKASLADNQGGIEPPKLPLQYMYSIKPGVNSTTPFINPEAVIDHDASSPKTSLTKSTKTMVVNQESVKKPTQAAASPLETPLKQQENAVELELNRQIPMPNNLDPQQSPENTVIKKPEFSDRDGGGKMRDDLVGENQGGEEDNVIAKPMNPIQEPAVPQGQNDQKHKALAMQWDEEGPQNGAHEEGEDDEGPAHVPNFRIGEGGELPRHMHHEYPGGGEYPEKDNQEDDDEEGEQMDYVRGEAAERHIRLKNRQQFDHNGGAGIMLNPK